MVLDFESSVLRLPSAEKNTRKLGKLIRKGWFHSNVVHGFLRDYHYECLFSSLGVSKLKVNHVLSVPGIQIVSQNMVLHCQELSSAQMPLYFQSGWP
uniref:Uncharacterized protein n=1 Tax=Tanacetum cinerariifolium TaxID=118510 RepID=A0A6L2JBV9_TANCI|nr:hypothetical protein [Tanacetum cinerariifolium]